MKKTAYFALTLFGVALSGCKSYVPQTYGPVEFESYFEGPLYPSGVLDAQIEFDFSPEDFDISRDDVHSMILDEITLTTEYENGFGDFENISFMISADGVEAANVATINITDNSKELVVPGLAEGEIKKFKNVKKYYLQITAVAKPDIEETYEDIDIKGAFSMSIMIPDKK